MAQPILRADLTDQHIEDAGRRINMGVNEVDSISELFENGKFDKTKTNIKFRTLVPQRISEDDVDSYILHENIAPKNRSLKYATFSQKVKKYATRQEYTAENVEENPDSVIADATEDLENWAIDMKKYLAVKALKGTHSSVTYATSFDNTFKKAYVILHDVLEARPWAGNQYLAVMPGILNLKLQDEILALNGGNTAMAVLPQEEKMKAFKDYIGSWRGFGIKTPEGANEFLQDSTNYYMFFIGKTRKGKNPLRRLTWDGDLVQLKHHPLGSGILKDADGNVVADYNDQKGGIGCNLKGIAYYIEDDRFVLMCTIAKSSITPVDITGEIPADGDDDGSVVQTLERVITNHGGTMSGSATLAITGATAGDDIPNGSSVQLSANHDVVWSSSDTTKMVVDQTGKVTAKAASGSVTISAFDGTSTATISLDCAAAA